MDDFEKAIIISFDESGNVDPALKSQALAFCHKLKENPSICRVCIERLSFTECVEVQFWCLQALHESLRLRYSSIPPEERSFIRISVLSIADHTSTSSRLSKPFIKNKLAQVLVTLVRFEYPLIWSSVFLDFLSRLGQGGPLVIDMFCRLLNSLDDELISQDYPRTAEETSAATLIKDAMRQQCVPQIVRAWYEILVLYKNSEAELCATVLDTMRRYIIWIDIGLVANDAFIPLLFELILNDGQSEPLRTAAAGCLHAVVAKRMEPQLKLSLLRSLHVSRIFSLITGDFDSEFVSRLATFVIGYSFEVLECSKRLDSGDFNGFSVELLDEVLPSVFHIMQKCGAEDTFNIVQFLSGYVSTMKSLLPLKEKQIVHIRQILEVILVRICYDPFYRHNLSLPDKIGQEEEDRMNEYRKDLFVLLRAVGRVAPDVTHTFIRNSLKSALGSTETNVEEVEAAISLFYAIGELISDEGIRTGNGTLREMVPILLSAHFSCHSHRLVALAYLETVTRYVKLIQEESQYIPLVLAAFLDERGIRHPNINVSGRASYLFMRVVKLLKSKLAPFMETILQNLQDTFTRSTCLGWGANESKCYGIDDAYHIFEATGLLIGMENVTPEKQSEYLSALLSPLCRQVEMLYSNVEVQNPEESSTKIANIQQVVMAINALSKGFSSRLVTSIRPGIGMMFEQTLDVLLQILVVFPRVEPLQNKVTSFIHRMVDVLGVHVIPHLPKALEQLLADSEPKQVSNCISLINQLISKFDASFGDILEKIFPNIVSKALHILPRDESLSGPGSNTEEIRELQELQRLMCIFLHSMTTHNLSSIFLAPKCVEYLNPIMQFLLQMSCKHKDILIRKACVQIFIRLIKDWCIKSNNEEMVPGFQSFIIENFATNCCLYSVLDKSFEFRDANCLILLGEIVMAQQVMYQKFGDDFLIHFMSKGFPSAHLPQNIARQYCEKLQGSDLISLKLFYQSFIESLRRELNGSLVFR